VVIVEAAYSKRRQREEQPIPTWLAARLRVWLAKRPGQPMLWVDPQVLWPGSRRRHAAEMLREDLKAAEIDYRDAAGRVFNFHALRHQYVSDLAAAGVHPRVAQGLARHSTIELTMNRYTHVAMHDVVGAVEAIAEPISITGTTLRATGTTDPSPQGDARVTAQASSAEEKRHFAGDSAKENLRVKNAAKSRPRKKLDEAEGMGLEPTTPCGAPHFQCGRWPIRLPSECGVARPAHNAGRETRA
jgi:hypothetical protein